MRRRFISFAGIVLQTRGIVCLLLPIDEYNLLGCSENFVFTSQTMAQSIFGPLRTNSATVVCDVSTGVSLISGDNYHPKPIESDTPRSSIQRHFSINNTTGLSISMWISPASFAGQVQPILTLGRGETGPISTAIRGCPGYGLQIAQFERFLHISYADNDSAGSCRTLVAKNHQLQESSLVHVTLSIGDSTSVTIDGQPTYQALQNDFDPTLSTWDPNLTLQLLTNYASRETFRGSISHVAIYDKPMTHADSLEAYRKGRGEEAVPLLFLDALPAIQIPQDYLNAVEIKVTGGLRLAQPQESYIEFLHVPQYGTLSLGNKVSSMITKGSRVPYIGPSSNISLAYLLTRQDVFTTPVVANVSVEERFAVRLVSGSHVSTPVTRNIEIVHVNHGVSLSADANLTIPAEGQHLLVENVRLFDPEDYDLDEIRVQISATYGKLTLDVENRHLADFDSCRQHPQWQCTGDGVRDRLMTFVATPNTAETVLSNLRYETFRTEPTSDNITIQVWDGEDGQCLTADDHLAYSLSQNSLPSTIRRECYHRIVTVAVPEVERTELQNEERTSISGWLSSRTEYFDWKVAIFLLLAVGIADCCCCFKFLHDLYAHFMAKGANVEILQAPKESESVAAYSDDDDDDGQLESQVQVLEDSYPVVSYHHEL